MFLSFRVPLARVCQSFVLLLALIIAGCSASPQQKAQSHYERGMQLLAQKDDPRAAVEFRNALKFNKELVGAWLGLIKVEENKQNWQAVVPMLRTVVELEPKHIEARLQLAKLAALSNALDEALKYVNAAGELDPRNAEVLAVKASILLKLNDLSGAVREALSALEIDPANAPAAIVLSAERLARGDTAGALQFLESIAHKDDFGVNLFKIRIFEQTGNLQQVEAVLRKLVDRYPQEPAFRRQLVRFLVNQKRPDDAERELRVWSTANPTNIDAGLDVVRFLFTVKGHAAAQQELITRINAGGEVVQYEMMLAELYFGQGNFKDSEALLERLANAGSREQGLTALIKLSEMYLSRKNLDAAEARVASILGKDSRNVGGLKLRASIRMERGQFEAAIADLRQALNDQPRSTDLMLLLATAYERSGSIELAEKQYADATRVSNFDPTVGLSYVAFLERRGSTARAEDVLTELASRSPTNVRVLSALANVRLTRQNWTGAQEIADAIRRIGNEGGLADQVLGAALGGRNKLDESISVLQNAYAAAPNAVQPLFALVSTMVRAGETDKAIAFLRSVLEKNPANAEARVLIGSIQLVRNEPEQALQSFKTAIERQPKNAIGYRALADFHLSAKKLDEAQKVIQAGLQVEPDNYALRLALAGTLEQSGNYEAAIAEYEQMLKDNTGSLIVANNLASLLSDHRADKASLDRAYSLAVSLRKTPVPQFKDTLGWVMHQRGDYKSSVSLLEEAVAALPNVGMVRYHLGMSYLANGQPTQASEQLKKALEMASNNPQLTEKIKAALKKIKS